MKETNEIRLGQLDLDHSKMEKDGLSTTIFPNLGWMNRAGAKHDDKMEKDSGSRPSPVFLGLNKFIKPVTKISTGENHCEDKQSGLEFKLDIVLTDFSTKIETIQRKTGDLFYLLFSQELNFFDVYQISEADILLDITCQIFPHVLSLPGTLEGLVALLSVVCDKIDSALLTLFHILDSLGVKLHLLSCKRIESVAVIMRAFITQHRQDSQDDNEDSYPFDQIQDVWKKDANNHHAEKIVTYLDRMVKYKTYKVKVAIFKQVQFVNAVIDSDDSNVIGKTVKSNVSDRTDRIIEHADLGIEQELLRYMPSKKNANLLQTTIQTELQDTLARKKITPFSPFTDSTPIVYPKEAFSNTADRNAPPDWPDMSAYNRTFGEVPFETMTGRGHPLPPKPHSWLLQNFLPPDSAQPPVPRDLPVTSESPLNPGTLRDKMQQKTYRIASMVHLTAVLPVNIIAIVQANLFYDESRDMMCCCKCCWEMPLIKFKQLTSPPHHSCSKYPEIANNTKDDEGEGLSVSTSSPKPDVNNDVDFWQHVPHYFIDKLKIRKDVINKSCLQDDLETDCGDQNLRDIENDGQQVDIDNDAKQVDIDNDAKQAEHKKYKYNLWLKEELNSNLLIANRSSKCDDS